MKANQKVNIGLLIPGLIITLIGLAHIAMPVWGYSSEVRTFFAKDKEIDNHFYFLATYAICSFLLFIGIVTVYVSTIKYSKIQFYFSLLSIILWLSRLILEIGYPVNLSLYGVAKPSSNLVIVFVLIITLLTYAAIKSYRQTNQK